MIRPALFALALLATPAFAQSDLSPAQIGTAFCTFAIAAEMDKLTPLLTPGLAEITAGTSRRWHSGTTPVTACMPVGATGSAEHPQSVLFLSFADGTTASDRLVLSFVGQNVRIDDVAYAGGGTLRESLASP